MLDTGDTLCYILDTSAQLVNASLHALQTQQDAAELLDFTVHSGQLLC